MSFDFRLIAAGKFTFRPAARAGRPFQDRHAAGHPGGPNVAKNLIQIFSRPTKPGAAPGQAVETPLVLEDDRTAALMVEDAQEMPASPLQVLANAIQKASADLHQIDE